MGGKLRPAGLIVGLLGCALTGYALFSILSSAGCAASMDTACPGDGFFTLLLPVGIVAAVAGMLLGGGAVVFGGLFLAIGLGALAAATPAFAQAPAPATPPAGAAAQTPPSSEQDVIVTGTLEREQEIRDFVGALTGSAPMTGQISRFEDSICPGVYGLNGQARETVRNRMRQVAAYVGLRVSGPNCRPNVLLMVTRDKRAFLGELADRHPEFFDEEEFSPRRVIAQPGPVAAWQATISLSAVGQPLPVQGGFGVNRSMRSQSHITAATRPVFTASAVVVEANALTGLSTIQLADYALMRGLARTDPHRLPAGSPPSILTAIEAPMGSEVPVTITRWDLGFLRGLYASTANLRAPQQRGEIGRRIGTELDRQSERN
jgi:hypothetical protein